MKKGTRIYYTGDMANESSFGTITNVQANSFDGFFDVTLDDGRKITGIYFHAIGTEYEGHCNPRFVTLDAYNKFRRNQ